MPEIRPSTCHSRTNGDTIRASRFLTDSAHEYTTCPLRGESSRLCEPLRSDLSFRLSAASASFACFAYQLQRIIQAAAHRSIMAAYMHADKKSFHADQQGSFRGALRPGWALGITTRLYASLSYFSFKARHQSLCYNSQPTQTWQTFATTATTRSWC
jgi:hypothetical protein